MDRREVLGFLGSLGVGLTLPSEANAQADEKQGHEHPKHSPNPAGSPTPAANFNLHFCGIHAAKHDRETQLIVQHYCGPLGDMHQCLLFASDEKGQGKNAKLIGVEYIISDAAYQKLPAEEKKYWHPHTYEVLGGGLIAPEMSPDDEMKFMKAILTTWGKTWHTWPDPTTAVPIGEPMLMWAITGDGQVNPQVVAERDRQFHVSAEKIRETRIAEIGYQIPHVPYPKSIDQPGRQWTAEGEDKPVAIPKSKQ